MDYKGVIIEESLQDKAVLKQVSVTSTKVEPVTEVHKTPWLKQWTLHTVHIPRDKAHTVAELLSRSLGDQHWYADFKNDATHYIIFANKVFVVDRTKAQEYQQATEYGRTLGIPEYQLDFSPHIVQWQRPA